MKGILKGKEAEYILPQYYDLYSNQLQQQNFKKEISKSRKEITNSLHPPRYSPRRYILAMAIGYRISFLDNYDTKNLEKDSITTCITPMTLKFAVQNNKC